MMIARGRNDIYCLLNAEAAEGGGRRGTGYRRDDGVADS
jgi:hypothetical protein